MNTTRMTPATTYTAIVGGVLTQIRNQKNLRQEDLAQSVGVTQATWSRIEKGQSSITVEHLRLAANKIDTPPNEILDLADQAEISLRSRGVQVFHARDDLNRNTAIAVIASLTLLAVIAAIIATSKHE